MGVRTFTAVIAAERAGARLDRLIADLWPELSRKLAQRIIAAGGCYLDGRRRQVAASPAPAGGRLKVCVDPDQPFRTFRLEPSAILFEDDDLLVVDKPSGTPVALSATGQEGSVQLGVAEHLARAGAAHRPAVLHRLDQPTSGVLLFAKNEPTEKAVYELFRRGGIRKTYLALVHPAPARPEGRIEAAIARRVDRRNQYKVSRERGKASLTEYRRLGGGPDGTALLAVTPRTGRSHQIRVHLAWIGAPIAGDVLYGGAAHPAVFGLHARRLELPHPRTNRPVAFAAPVPAAWLAAFPWLESITDM